MSRFMIIDAFSCPFALWCVCASVLLCCALFFFAGNFFAPSAERQEEDHTRADNAHLVKENADVKLPRVEGHEDCVQTVRGASAPPIIVQQTKKGQPPKPGLAFPTTHTADLHRFVPLAVFFLFFWLLLALGRITTSARQPLGDGGC